MVWLSGRALNLLQLGDELATGAGLNPFRARILLIVIAMVLVAPVIAAIGPISFIALFAPHLLRWWVGSDLRRLVPAAGLSGGALVLVADLVARNLRPADVGEWLSIPLNTNAVTLPVGVYLALIGGPFFLLLLRRTRG